MTRNVRLLSFLIALVGILAFAQSSPPPNALDWNGVRDRILQAEQVVLLSAERLEPDLVDDLAQLGYRGVQVYLLTNESEDVLVRLERSGATALGEYVGFMAIVDDSIFVYLPEYEAYIETASPMLARLYLKRFGIEPKEEL